MTDLILTLALVPVAFVIVAVGAGLHRGLARPRRFFRRWF